MFMLLQWRYDWGIAGLPSAFLPNTIDFLNRCNYLIAASVAAPVDVLLQEGPGL
jgi:hypothetical protein